jgi:hypothetical protein
MMRIKPVVALSAAAITAVMALNVTTATARTLSIGPSQRFRETFNDIEFFIAETRGDCRLTLEGSLHTRTMAKVAGALLGYITRVTAAECVAAMLTETLPWHVRYEGFSGTLPNITLLVVRVRLAIRIQICLSETDLRVRFIVNGDPSSPTYRRITGIEVPLQNIPTNLCGPVTLRSNGNGSLTVLGTTEPVTVLLI